MYFGLSVLQLTGFHYPCTMLCEKYDRQGYSNCGEYDTAPGVFRCRYV